MGQLLPELADEDVDDLQLGLVHATVEVVEEHLLRQRRPLAQGEELEDLVFLAGEVDRLAVDLDRLRVEVHRRLSGGDRGLRVTLRAPHNRMDPGDQLVPMERLRHVVVGSETESLDLRLGVVLAGEDQDRGVDPCHAELLENVVAVHVRQVQVEKDQIVVVELREIDPLFAEVGRVDVEVGMAEHQLDAAGGRRIVLDQKNTHVETPERLVNT